MNLLNYGCTCKTCTEIRLRSLTDARHRWENGEREIIFKPWDYECGDGCCSDYGVDVYINGFEMPCDGDNPMDVLEGVMEFLGFDGVKMDYDYDDN